MTPTPPSTASSSTGARSPDGQYRVVRKRNRVPVSCGPCRYRKLKCNRANPCENCVKRGDAVSCSYAAPGARKKNQSSLGNSKSSEMQLRIDRLEGLVLSLMTSGSQPASSAAATAALSSAGSASSSTDLFQPPDGNDDDMIKEESEGEESEVDHVTDSLGIMKVDANKSTYFGDSHWATLLHDIKEVKAYFADHGKQFEAQSQKLAAQKMNKERDQPAFLLGGAVPKSKSELVAALPSRAVVNKLVSRYFNSCDPAVYILHGPTFQREYETRWNNLADCPIIWLAQLFAVMCLAVESYDGASDEPPEYKGKAGMIANIYRRRTADCLVAADLSKPECTMISTLILYLQGQYRRDRDAEFDVWVLVGMIARLAMRMGYHRDPSHYPAISPFAGEMRRRVWTYIRLLDTLFSFQLGLPNMIRDSDCDTALPRSLFDDEIGPEMTELPPSRPESEPTPVLYMITKAKITALFGRVVDTACRLGPVSYEDVLKLDQLVREGRASIPPHLKLRPMEESPIAPATLIMQQFHLDLLSLKTLCVLHRRFFTKSTENPGYALSRRTCVEASMQLLRHQKTLHRESQPGGRLRSQKLFTSSLTTQDFFLADMVVCIDVCHPSEAQNEGTTMGSLYKWGPDRRREKIEALEMSNAIWREYINESMEAFKANLLLGVMLEKIYKGPSGGAQSAEATRQPTTNVFAEDESRPEHSAAMTLGLLSSGGLTPAMQDMDTRGFPLSPGTNNVLMSDAMALTPGPFQFDPTGSITSGPTQPPFPSFSAGPGMMDMPTNLDWDAWESFVQGASLDQMNTSWPAEFMSPLPSTREIPSTAPPGQINLYPDRDGGGYMGNENPGGGGTM